MTTVTNVFSNLPTEQNITAGIKFILESELYIDIEVLLKQLQRLVHLASYSFI